MVKVGAANRQILNGRLCQPKPVTKRDTNKPMSRAEKRKLLRAGFTRIPRMAEEAKWAVKIAAGPGFAAPPAFVRPLIMRALGVEAFRRMASVPVGARELAGRLGAARGLASGTQVLLAEPVADEGIAGETRELLSQISAAMTAIAGPQLARAECFLAEVPADATHGSVAVYASYCEGESSMASSLATILEEDNLHETVADELCYFLWMYWPQVQTAGSVRELHAWIEATGLISCSMKLVEKVCRQVGLRFSPRGRRRHSDNRIPTD